MEITSFSEIYINSCFLIADCFMKIDLLLSRTVL